MIAFTLYDPGSGRVLGGGSAANEAAAKTQAIIGGVAVLLKESLGQDWMVVGGELVQRPRIDGFGKSVIAANGIDETSMAVPAGATVKIDGTGHVIDDGELVLASLSPGVWTVEIDHWPYLPYRGIVTCV